MPGFTRDAWCRCTRLPRASLGGDFAGLSGRPSKNGWEGLKRPCPSKYLDRAKLMPLQRAIAQANYPDGEALQAEARRRLAFDELLTLQLAVLSRKRRQGVQSGGIRIKSTPQVLKGFLESLPFDLTGAQQRSISEIISDLEVGSPPMNRLLQGEVGSGKTVVALASIAHGGRRWLPGRPHGPNRSACGAALPDGVPAFERPGQPGEGRKPGYRLPGLAI